MAGDNPKSFSNNKRPPPPSERKSRWESSSSRAANTTTSSAKPSPSKSSNKPSASDSNPPSAAAAAATTTTTTSTTSRPSSDKRGPGPNPSPLSHPLFPFTEPPLPSFLPPPRPLPPPPPPPPSYGVHMLDRRTLVLADGTVRSYFALPPDYQDFITPPRLPMGRFGPRPEMGRLPPVGPISPDGFHNRDDPKSMSIKRKFGYVEERDREGEEFVRQKQQLLQYGNAGANLGSSTSSLYPQDDDYRTSKYMRVGAGDGGGGFHSASNNVGMRQDVRVDPAVMKAFLRFVKLINENSNQRKNYVENGKYGSLQCLACGRSSKDFPDVHALIMHALNSDNADLRVDHLGLHKALCVVMGWNYLRPPDISRAYQLLPAEEAAANQDDLILWPPMVIINNTNTGKGKDGRMEGLGNKAMDSKLRDLGFSGGKSKSLYSRDGHLGITLIKFASDQSGLKEAMRLADHFEKEHHGRRDWARVQSTATDRDEDSNPNLVLVDQRTGERRRILYGYLATAFDMDKVDFDTRKKVVIESKHEKLHPSQ